MNGLLILAGKGLDVNLRDASGNTLMDIAADRLNESVTLRVQPSTLQRLAFKNPTAGKALGWLQTHGIAGPYVPFTNVTILQILTSLGINTSGTNQWGETLLHRVVSGIAQGFERYGENWGELGSRERVKRIEALLSCGLLLEARDRRGQTPFLAAVQNYHRVQTGGIGSRSAGKESAGRNRIPFDGTKAGPVAFTRRGFKPGYALRDAGRAGSESPPAKPAGLHGARRGTKALCRGLEARPGAEFRENWFDRPRPVEEIRSDGSGAETLKTQGSTGSSTLVTPIQG